MAKIFVRVDDRLIHGQTVLAWGPTLSIKEIIAIDDESAKNPMLRSIMTMGVPSSYKTHIVTTEEALQLLAKEGSGNRLVIVKFPSQLSALAEVIAKAEWIMLGNVAKRADTTHKMGSATDIFYLSEEDVEVLDGFHASGMEVCFQQLPSTAKTSWESFKKSI